MKEAQQQAKNRQKKNQRKSTHWTLQEAHCIYQLIDDLKSAVWASYGTEIMAMFDDIKNDQEHDYQQTEFNDVGGILAVKITAGNVDDRNPIA